MRPLTEVPEFQHIVRTARQSEAAIGRKGERKYVTAMANELMQLPARRCAKKFYGSFNAMEIAFFRTATYK